MTIAISSAILGLIALVALHRLRSRPEPRRVATLLFWQQDASVSTARTLGGRFKHWRTFALLCTIVLLTSLALAVDAHRAHEGIGDVLVIDAGQSMAAVDAAGRSGFDRAIDAARSDLDRCLTPAVLLAGSTPVTLTTGGEPTAVVSHRLDGQHPQAGASAAGPALQLAASMLGASPGRILWYTSQLAVPAGLPPTVRDRIEMRPVPAAPAAAMVAAVLIRGDRNANDLKVVLAGESDVPMVVGLKSPDALPDERPVGPFHGRSEVTFDGLAAVGQVVELSLKHASGYRNENLLTVQLPDDRPLSIQFDSAVPPTLESGLLAFGVRSTAGAISVTTAAEPLPAAARAAVVVLEDKLSAPAVRLPLSIEQTFAEGLRLEGASAVAAPGPRLPGRAVVSAGDIPVISLDESAARRTVYVRASVLSPDADMPRRAAFPLLLRRLCERLVLKTPMTVTVPALRVALDPLWLPTAAAAVAVVPDPPVDGPVRDVKRVMSPLPAGPIRVDILIPLALALLVVEGLLHAKRKIV